MKRLVTCIPSLIALLSLSWLLCSCIPEDLTDCPDSAVQTGGVDVTVGLDQPVADDSQETQLL